jgi:hypothetical protein
MDNYYANDKDCSQFESLKPLIYQIIEKSMSFQTQFGRITIRSHRKFDKFNNGGIAERQEEEKKEDLLNLKTDLFMIVIHAHSFKVPSTFVIAMTDRLGIV